MDKYVLIRRLAEVLEDNLTEQELEFLYRYFIIDDYDEALLIANGYYDYQF